MFTITIDDRRNPELFSIIENGKERLIPITCLPIKKDAKIHFVFNGISLFSFAKEDIDLANCTPPIEDGELSSIHNQITAIINPGILQSKIIALLTQLTGG